MLIVIKPICCSLGATLPEAQPEPELEPEPEPELEPDPEPETVPKPEPKVEEPTETPKEEPMEEEKKEEEPEESEESDLGMQVIFGVTNLWCVQSMYSRITLVCVFVALGVFVQNWTLKEPYPLMMTPLKKWVTLQLILLAR